MRQRPIKSNQQGFTYMIALFLVAILSVTMVAALEKTITKDRRDKEAQLLYVGQAYRTAIMRYYQGTQGSSASPGESRVYPPNLEALLEDTRALTKPHYLRRLYFDPMAPGTKWGEIRTKDGLGVIGVYSYSTQQPIKTSGFPPELANFIGAQTYQQWQFTYIPPTQ